MKIVQECMEPPPSAAEDLVQVHLRLWVDPNGHSHPPWPKPYFRGHGHLIFAGFDTQNSLLFDLRNSRVLGRLTPELAGDSAFWKIVVIPVLLTIVGSAVGRTVLHCACLAWRGKGVLLAGDSGSGKSTVSLALARIGFAFGSDDRTLFWLEGGHLQAHGLGPCVKLRPEALEHADPLEAHLPVHWQNEGGAVFLDPVRQCGVVRMQACEPEFVFFLEQAGDSAFSVEPMPVGEAALRLVDGLHQESIETLQLQKLVIDSIVKRECFLLRYAGDSHDIARALADFLADHLGHRKRAPERPAKTTTSPKGPLARRQDPLRRFTPLPLSAEFHPMRRHLLIETNSALVMEFARQALGRSGPAGETLLDFCWKVISDPDDQLEPPWPEMTAFSDGHVRFVNLGQRSFLAVDTECREAVAFVSRNLVKDEAGFASIVLASLFYLSAGALGLTAISASCIASAGKGLLLFGVPRSGKTTSCFMARGEGYLFHADQACFLEMEKGSLRAWGEFWPAAFHPEATEFLPELAELARPFEHRDAKYLCIDKNPSQRDEASSVLPVGCILLERTASGPPKLVPLTGLEFRRMLEGSIPFKDASVPAEARRAVHDALTKLPAYRLLCGDAPSAPSHFLRSLLSTHGLVECLR